MNQQVMDPKLAAEVRAFELQFQRWRNEKKRVHHIGWYLVAVAVPAWVVSFFMSAMTGPVYQAQWFAAVTIAAFIGAAGATLGAAVSFGLSASNPKPEPEYRIERNVEG